MKKECVQRINSWYVGDDCIQIAVSYRNALSILSQDTVLYHHYHSSNCFINEYLDDERRYNFPYSNIPTHCERRRFTKYNYTNQLFEFDKPYIRIGDGKIVESFVVKDGDEALLVNRLLTGQSEVKYMTNKELQQLFSKVDGEKLICLGYCGGFQLTKDGISYAFGDEIIPDEDVLVSYYREKIRERIVEYNKGDSGLFSDNMMNYFEKSLATLEINDLPFGFPICENYIIFRTDGEKIKIQDVSAWLQSGNNYKVLVTDIPVHDYCLEQIKFLSEDIAKTREPKIRLSLNPGVKKSDVQQAKQMVKCMKNNSFYK